MKTDEMVEILERIARDEGKSHRPMHRDQDVAPDRAGPRVGRAGCRTRGPDRRQARWLRPGVRKLIRELGAR